MFAFLGSGAMCKNEVKSMYKFFKQILVLGVIFSLTVLAAGCGEQEKPQGGILLKLTSTLLPMQQETKVTPHPMPIIHGGRVM